MQLLGAVPSGDPQRSEITERIASSIYKQGEQARSAGQLDVAVGHFLRVAQAAPSSPVRATAEYDAGAALIQMGDWQRATTVLENFRSSFPNHELAADVTTKLAVAYVEAGNSARAASEFERIADGDGPIEVKREALWRSAELYETTGQSVAATAAFGRFVERYPQPVAEAVEARQKLIDLSSAAGNHAERSRWMRDLVAADASAGAERTDRTRYLAAKSQLELATPTRDAFLGTRLVVPLDKSLAAKQTRMEEALAAYGKAADYGIAEVTTAANYEIAELYHALSKDLYASERPAELNDRRARAVRHSARGAGVPVRGGSDRAARDERGTHGRRHLRRMGAQEPERARRAPARTLREGRNRRDPCRSHSLISPRARCGCARSLPAHWR